MIRKALKLIHLEKRTLAFYNQKGAQGFPRKKGPSFACMRNSIIFFLEKSNT